MGEKNRLGEFLLNERKKRNLSLKDVENATEISASYINRLEKGNRNNPSMYVLEKLSSFYEINPVKVIELSRYESSEPSKDNSLSQNLSIFLDSSDTIFLDGKEIESKSLKVLMGRILDLNIDNFTEVINFLNCLKEFQHSLKK